MSSRGPSTPNRRNATPNKRTSKPGTPTTPKTPLKSDLDINRLLRQKQRSRSATPLGASEAHLDGIKEQVAELTQQLQTFIFNGDEEEAGRVATTLASLTKQLKASSKRQQDLTDIISSMQLQLDHVRTDLATECQRARQIRAALVPSEEKEARILQEVHQGYENCLQLREELDMMPTHMAVFPELEEMYATEYVDLLKANRLVVSAYDEMQEALSFVKNLRNLRL